ncbi:UNVERIFIED_CONTAM: hypothetical protein K2H54_042835 [Gekko kuhli]
MAKQLDSDLSEIPTMLGNCREPTQGLWVEKGISAEHWGMAASGNIGLSRMLSVEARDCKDQPHVQEKDEKCGGGTLVEEMPPAKEELVFSQGLCMPLGVYRKNFGE